MENASNNTKDVKDEKSSGINPNPVKDSEVTKYKKVTDDQFFDDFFDE